ncbi:MAG TPA: halocarboxylic acid dehydrogenase DehI family protein [Armatimonadota bacterium]|nr:halocarboxylic acid dehydrogenase DehI family protein [Armatimonadota bacterium]HOP79752.1 halocarboxylic acid dehydrogenase DehI family protein [Armatimonadota bacterium]HPP75110.1 halocarboxylic acid dehydrogenase DehI family protein [Armatimonadota bacterium]
MRRIETLEEGQARGRVKEIYKEIERAFGVPFVGGVFRALAQYPDVLESAWNQLKPNISTQSYVDLSNDLRQRADALAELIFELDDLYTWMLDHNFSREDIRKVLYTLEVLHYINPKLLLATAAITAGVMGVKNPQIKRRRESPITSQEPDYPNKLPQVMLEQASNEVKEDYYDIIAIMGLLTLPDDIQALGNWPTFLRRVWSNLKPVVRSATFLEESQNLESVAIESAQELPYPVEVKSDNPEVRRILESFMSMYARMCIGISAIRWMVMEGERTARLIGRAAGERPSEL